MKIDETLYKHFLEEMNELDNFRIVYASLNPGMHMEREDPDVRRLTEAMAFFAARTRMAGMRSISSTLIRFFQQYFPYMLTPLPSIAIARVTPTRQLAEPVFYPAGTELSVTTESGQTGIFNMTSSVNVLPFSPTRFSLLMLPERGFRVVMEYSAAFTRNDNIGTLSFFINYLNNFENSSLMFYNIRRHIKKVSVVFDEKANEFSEGEKCDISYGLPENRYEDEHPLAKERNFFHFPWIDLYLNIRLANTPHSWRTFSICLDIDHKWPKNLVLNQDVFQLFTVPLINIRKDAAQPLICSATQEKYPLRHPRLNYGFALHSVRGIYEITKEGMSFVKPGILSGTAPAYETEEITDSSGRSSTNLFLHFPKAFEDQRTITVDAFWYQPWLKDKISESMTLAPFSHAANGVKWDFMVKPVSHQEKYLHSDINAFLHFLTLTHKEVLNRDDIIDILQLMGAMKDFKFAHVCELLSSVRVEKVSSKNRTSSGLLRYRYILCFREYNQNEEPLVAILVNHLKTILIHWLSSADLEVIIENSGDRQNTTAAG